MGNARLSLKHVEHLDGFDKMECVGKVWVLRDKPNLGACRKES